MAITPSFPPDPKPVHEVGFRFSIDGRIVDWNPLSRRLQIGTNELWVSSSVPVVGLAPGVPVTITGHMERGRWIVTELTLA